MSAVKKYAPELYEAVSILEHFTEVKYNMWTFFFLNQMKEYSNQLLQDEQPPVKTDLPQIDMASNPEAIDSDIIKPRRRRATVLQSMSLQ